MEIYHRNTDLLGPQKQVHKTHKSTSKRLLETPRGIGGKIDLGDGKNILASGKIIWKVEKLFGQVGKLIYQVVTLF